MTPRTEVKPILFLNASAIDQIRDPKVLLFVTDVQLLEKWAHGPVVP